MKRSARWGGSWILAMVLLGSAACAPLRLAVPEPLAHEVQPVPVESDRTGLDKGLLRLAGFQVTWDQDGVSSGSAGLGVATACMSRSAYRFALASAAQPGGALRQVQCGERMTGGKAEVEVADGTLSAGRSQNTLSCTFDGGRLDLWQTERMTHWSGQTPVVEGRMNLGEVALTVESVSSTNTGAHVPYLGYHLRLEDAVVASVQAYQPPQLWLAPGLSDEVRGAVALTAAALLLQRTWTPEGPRDCDTTY